ncbi:MAG: Asp-tRNA(Asn)/Glu-tRNA(Gln) amidotransferase GatCAB subunit A [Candidatus Rokuibacteriota bacterium]|nr:MAG: Asp-tRNA(Asn)/Glu-tRNA(Gln) amidotransferase GatCAB subunit A [Candidatus Rokubacteria bacterium]
MSPSARSRRASRSRSKARAISASVVTDWTLDTLSRAIAARKISPVEATQACLARIEQLDPHIRAFITVDAEGALASARALEAELTQGRSRGSLHGVPLAYKDLCHVPGLPTSCGTRTREYFTSTIECTATARLREAGAVTLGKLNMTELAMGPFGDNAHHGDVQNPWKPGHCAGGSSSGSAAAVAAGFALGALGSDTGGSIRLPAACCGVVGLKPTYGRVSRAGAMPLSWSLDHLGPLTRTVADAARLLGIVAGYDPHDATSSRRGVPFYERMLDGPVGGLRVGVPENYYFDGVAAEIDASIRAAAQELEGLGARIVPLRVPDPRPLADVCNVISRSEAAAIHARLARERPHELQPAVRARIEVGFHISAHDYLQALRLRARLTREFIADVFTEVDALLAPVIPEPAPELAAVKAGGADEVVARMGRFSRLTRPFNGLGLPALALPCGRSLDGRPLALQIVGRAFDEATVLRLGHAYQQATAWHVEPPKVQGR